MVSVFYFQFYCMQQAHCITLGSFQGLVYLRDKLYHNVVINDIYIVNIQVTGRQCSTFHCLPWLLKIVHLYRM